MPASSSVHCDIHHFHAMLFGLCSVLLVRVVAGSTLHDKEVSAHIHSAQVTDQGEMRRHLLRKERKHSATETGASLLESFRISQRMKRTRYLPQFPTGPATCDGSQLQCPSDASVDPCSQLQNCSIGGHHDCQGSFKICLPKKGDPTKCESGDDCLLRCTGVFVEEKSDGSSGAPLCSDLSKDGCNGHYVADKDYTNNGLGYECALKDDDTCGKSRLCGVQNPPESLGEKQCLEPEVFKGATDGTCPTSRTRPGHECQTRCYTGYTPSVSSLKCTELGEFEPKTFTCEPNPCKVKAAENALASGCKEGPSAGEATIQSGEECTVQCKDGFYPSDTLLRCHSETLSPATFTCEAPCSVPTVQNAAAGGICKEANDRILPFTDCTAQCAAGYSPSVRTLSCRSGSFTPSTVRCTPDACDAPAGVASVAKEGACKEGATVGSGSSCTAQCAAGYTVSVSKLSCSAGTLTPATFSCAPNPCVLPDVEQSNGCKGVSGKSIESGKVCETLCKPGYTASVGRLTCLAASLTPASFTCNPDACTVPFDKNQEGSGCIGVSGTSGIQIDSSDKCRTQCKAGYHPSASSLSCFAGTLTPPTWQCEEDPCPAPKNIKNAPQLTCRQGDSIVSGTSCTTLCNPGYSPRYKSLACKLGEFSPPNYVCVPDPCPVPAVANRLGSGCKDVGHPAIIGPGQSCITQCREGYSPSVEEQKCSAGTMTPAFWSCQEDPCEAPSGIKNTKQPCKEGKSVDSGALCTATCADGFSPSTPSLVCSQGQFTPATFTCAPEPCSIPQVADRQGSGCKNIKGKTVTSGSDCIPVCKAGFSPTESSLRCTSSKLSPATFVCEPDSCMVTPIVKAKGTGCNGGFRSRVDSGGVCNAECLDGYVPSTSKLACYAGVFTPSTFTCEPIPCTIPNVQNKAGSGCLGIPGTSVPSGGACKAHCLGGYSPSTAQLTCSAGTLTPATFSCSPDACAIPVVTNRKGNGCKGVRGKTVASGAVCETVCINGFSPSVAKLECSAGSLSPNNYICQEDSCKAVTGVPNAPSVACQEGANILGGKSCTPRCNAGYSPSETALACRRGELNPSSFECKPDACDMPYVANSENPTCAEGNSIASGKQCTPRCKSGYSASTGALSCRAGTLSPATFLCRAPCAPPNVLNAASICKEGNQIAHGRSCTTQCNAGYIPNKASLECSDGVLAGGPVFCVTGPPPVGGKLYQCWHGDPHFTCRGGRRSDPLIPGTHWVLKQSCPGSPNFMWVQGVYGPVRPAVTMATAFGGHFLGKNVLTIRVNRNPAWIVKWNGENIVTAWKKKGRHAYKFELAGSELTVTWANNRIDVALSYGVAYRAVRRGWNRQNHIRVSGFFYQDVYMNNALWANTCKGGRLLGEAVQVHRGYRPKWDNRYVNPAYDMFKRSSGQIENQLDKLTKMASLLDDDGVEYLNVTVTDEPPCTGDKLEAAKKACAVLKKEKTEEEKEEIEEDKEAKETQEATYWACISDVCNTASKNFGEDSKETEEESEMEAALKHKKEFKTAAANAECKKGWKPTDGADTFLSETERSRANDKKEKCNCRVCRPEHRRYLVGPMALHNETKEACQNQRLAMPKSEDDKARLWSLQKHFTNVEKSWLGASYKDGGWKWSDETAVDGGSKIDGKDGDYLCLDKDDGKLINCEHRADERNGALCETLYY